MFRGVGQGRSQLSGRLSSGAGSPYRLALVPPNAEGPGRLAAGPFASTVEVRLALSSCLLPSRAPIVWQAQ